MLLTYTPGPPLSRYVEALWCYDVDGPVHTGHERVLPNGRMQIVIDLASGNGAVSGMRSRYVAIEPAAIGSVAGIVFRPGGARGFLPVPCGELYNQIVPLDAVWGASFRHLRESVCGAPGAREKLLALETALREIVQRGTGARFALHPLLEHALREFRRLPHTGAVGGVARDAGWSRRRLTQLFGEQIGMAPKRYCCLVRFRQVVRRIGAGERVDWAGVAAAGGYCDQAHLAHEFREFCGLSPTGYLAAERPFANHVRLG